MYSSRKMTKNTTGRITFKVRVARSSNSYSPDQRQVKPTGSDSSARSRRDARST